ncbi:MAG: hypothetical protein ACLQDV_30405 [Candidatus Binataceae bacterium]
MTRRSSHKAPAIEAAAPIGIALAMVLLLPRLVRLFYPEVWVEDDFYLESAYLVSAGMRPYLDFVHQHFPVLEWTAGAYIWLFGASHLSFEFLNEAAIYATSLLVFALGRRVAGRPAAIASAILYGFASLVFRYHVYERECFVAPLVVAAAIFTLDDDSAEISRRAGSIAALLFLACAIKLTAVIPAAVIIGYIAIFQRAILKAIAIAVCIAVLIAALSAFCYWRYGFAFVFETFFFHFMKGRDTAGAIALYPRLILDIMAPLLVLDVVRICAAREWKAATILVVALATAEYIFFGLLSPTAWGHNYLEALPFIAIIAGLGATRLFDALRNLITQEMPARVDWAWVVGGGLFILICLVAITPLVNENWLHDSIYGFGFVPRDEIAEIASAIRGASSSDDNIVAPSFLCFEANRPELIRYPETYGIYREAEAEYERDGFFAARSRLGNADFFALIGDTAHYWTDQIRDAITGRKVKVVVSDSPIQLLPLVRVPPEMLAQNGYRPILRTAHYVVWALAPAPSP